VLQPFVGGIYNITPDLFVQGFSSLAVPTDSRDITIWYNSIGLGYWVYRGQPTEVISGVVPTVELHFNTVLNHQNDIIPRLDDTANLTGGVHINLFNNAIFGVAVGVPVSGPRPYDYEVISSLNLRF